MEQRHNGAGAGACQPDYSGLQVVPSNALPEAVPGSLSWKQEGAYAYALPPAIKPGEHGAPEVAVSHMPEPAAHPVPPSSPCPIPWWKRKRWILAIILAVLIIVGAVVGGVVGSRSTSSPSSPSSTSPSSDPSPGSGDPSACRDALCPQILAAAVEELDGDGTTSSLHLFARGVDRSIWHTSTALASGAPSYAAFASFFDGPFVSQPAALAWGAGTVEARRVGVFAVSDPDRGVRFKTLRGGSGGGSDDNVGGPVAGPVALCVSSGVRPDLWAVALTGIAHNFGNGNDTIDSFWSQGRNVPWQGSAEFGTIIKGGRPGVVCRRDDFAHDVVVYGEADGAVRHSAWSGATGWTRPTTRASGTKFQGEPLLVGVADDRFDFFGIGEDKAMYHFTWTKTGGFTTLENLGGSFVSVPSAAVTSTGGRIDVVALGTTGTLQHRVLRGLEWVGDWEDLGVVANSAPLLVNATVKATGTEKVAAFVVGRGGEVNQTMWTASSDLSWKSLVWTSLGGNMTTSFLS